ncbi:MAG: inositol-3-phosphate synthase [Syntrophobacteraceae bacterium]
MKNRKTGVWLIGARGSIATTVLVGSMLMRKGLAGTTGMVTALPLFDGLQLAPLETVAFGGWDVRSDRLFDTACAIARETRVFDRELLDGVRSEIEEAERFVRPGTVLNCGEAIERLASPECSRTSSLQEIVKRLRSDLRDFRTGKSLDTVVVVNLASTEPSIDFCLEHAEPAAFEACLRENRADLARASALYAWAAVEEGCPYINFTPSNAALTPALVKRAEERSVPLMGNDGKTGETLVKATLAPMFLCRNLEVMSWEGFNLLGNLDGRVLNNPENKAAKISTKDGVLANILGYTPHSRVHIEYVPSLDDQKTAWDFIHFRGFLGTKMSLQFVWQGFDSILAAPLVLDLARLAELAERRGESGLMPHLASFFKAPLGVSEHRLPEQFAMLRRYVEQRRS